MITDPDPLMFSDPRLRHVYSYWQGKSRAGRLPARADVDPIELRQVLPRLMLVDVKPAPDFV